MKGYLLLPMLFVSAASHAAAGPAVSGGDEPFAVIGSVSVEIEQTRFTILKDDIQGCLQGSSLEAQVALKASDVKTKLRCQMHGFEINDRVAPQYRVERINSTGQRNDVILVEKGRTTRAQWREHQDRILCVASSGLRCWSK